MTMGLASLSNCKRSYLATSLSGLSPDPDAMFWSGVEAQTWK